VTDLNEAERRFAAYLDAHDYSWSHEPDYQAALGLPAPPATTPDFLLMRDGVRCACEVRQFEGTGLRDALELAGGYLSTGPEVLYKPLRWALVEKAEQLRPLAGAAVPLVIVFANPLGADVILDDHHVAAAMFGNASFRIPIDPVLGGMPEGAQGQRALENYGVFRSPVLRDGQVEHWMNRHPHVSAVAVVHERTHAADWRDEIAGRYRAEDNSTTAAVDAMFEAHQDIAAQVAAGQEPLGAYQWVSVYELDGEEAVPAHWFNGSRDKRFGFHSKGGYGEL
jgi:hypothetical protein